jgi:spore germination cell wall hydrolase CwlJ-like protein
MSAFETDQAKPSEGVSWTASFIRAGACLLLFASLSAPAQIADGHSASQALAAQYAARASGLSELANLTLAENARIIGTGHTAEEGNAAIPFASGPVEEMGAFRAIALSSQSYDQALRCLTQAIYYEAANEPEQGKRAVAQVVLNRLRHPAYPSSVCGVVYEGWNQPVCQFSFVCDGSLLRAPMAMQWRQSQAVARAALAGHVESSVGSATHYHADYVLPRWAYTLSKVRQIGRHLFYRFPGRGGRTTSFTARWNGLERIPQLDFSDMDLQLADLEAGAQLYAQHLAPAADPTDRRADNDVGGRLDPNKGWRLTIPDPVNASASYNASLAAQTGNHRVAMSANGGHQGDPAP